MFWILSFDVDDTVVDHPCYYNIVNYKLQGRVNPFVVGDLTLIPSNHQNDIRETGV